MAQIIDENANVCEGLEGYLDQIGITKAGLNYHTLSIIGCQSSGKSTLLNALFRTSFATMNESTGRQQTTKGIHAAFNSSNVLIFDIEGSDSRERGDADALFERKAALFGLALSEVVMVNMWENDIGRYNASSIPLLRTVFEVNLQLFASSSEAKCHLLFVIRDSTQSEEIICGQVKRDLDLIWKDLVLPQNLQGKKFEDFFVFHFFSLPHLRLKPKEFQDCADKLAAKFIDPQNDGFFFAQPMGKLIPGDGLGQYIHSVWNAISENRELNLPSQRKTLSNFRCEEFANAAFEAFELECEAQIRQKIDNVPFHGFRDAAQELVAKAIQQYNNAAGKYVREIVVEKRQGLTEKMSASLYPSFQTNCNMLLSIEKDKFEIFIRELPEILEETEGWEMNANEKRDEMISMIDKFVADSMLPDFKWEFNYSTLQSDLTNVIQSRLEMLSKEMEDRIFARRNNPYKGRINVFLDTAEQDMWEKIRAEMKSEIKETQDEIDSILKKNTLSNTSSEKLVSMFYKSTISQVLSASEFVPQKMNIRFEEKFLQDENHNSRVWGINDDIPAAFEVARESGMMVLKMFTNCQLRDPDTPIPRNDILTKQILTPIKMQAIESEFNEAIEKNYITAVQIKESKIVRNDIPLWMWIVIAITGYQKLVNAVRHPFYAIFLFALIGLVFYLYKSGNLDIIITFIKEYFAKALIFIIGLLKNNTNDLELPPSIRESAKKADTLDKEAIKKGIETEESRIIPKSEEISTGGINISDNTSQETPSSPPSQKADGTKKRTKSKIQRSFSTLQPNFINPADLQNVVKKRQHKHGSKPIETNASNI